MLMGKIHTTFKLPPLTTIMILQHRGTFATCSGQDANPKPPPRICGCTFRSQVGSQVQNEENGDGNLRGLFPPTPGKSGLIKTLLNLWLRGCHSG